MPSSTRSKRSRRPSADSAPAKPSDRLTRDHIVRAAVALTKRVGLDSLTMRALADELGVTPMATYYYVHNKTELVDLVIEAVMAAVPVPDPASGTWSERMWRVNRDTRKATAAHPGLAEALLDRPPTPAARRHIQAVIDCLLEAGFAPDDAQVAYTMFESCMFGRMAIERAHRAPISTDAAYRWAFDTLIAGFEARIAAPTGAQR
jgi:AcrR family transcriptional regulator